MALGFPFFLKATHSLLPCAGMLELGLSSYSFQCVRCNLVWLMIHFSYFQAEHFAFLLGSGGGLASNGCTRLSVRNVKFLSFLVSDSELISLQLQHHSLQSSGGFAERLLEYCLERLVICIYRYVVFSI